MSYGYDDKQPLTQPSAPPAYTSGEHKPPSTAYGQPPPNYGTGAGYPPPPQAQFPPPPPPPPPSAAHHTNIVVVGQPAPAYQYHHQHVVTHHVDSGGVKPPNYIVLAALSLLFCWPISIIAIIYALQVDSAWASGDRLGAMRSSRLARTWSTLAYVIGAVLILAAIVVTVVRVVLMVSLQ